MLQDRALVYLASMGLTARLWAHWNVPAARKAPTLQGLVYPSA